MQAVEDDVGAQALQPLGRALDLANAGEEGEHAAVGVGKRGADRAGHAVLDPLFGGAAEVAQFERVAAAFAFHHRCVV